MLDAMKDAQSGLEKTKSAILEGKGGAYDLYEPAFELAQIRAAQHPGLWFAQVDAANLFVWVSRDVLGERTGERSVDVHYC